MADKGYVKSLINGISDENTRKVLALAFTEVLDNFTLGPVEDMARSVNGQSYFFQATTSTAANVEFSVQHGQGQIPLWIRSILPLDAVNARMVDLTVTRVADEQRLYLSSPSTSATVFMEVGF